MDLSLRLSDVETEALRRKTAEEGRSMQEVARTAICRSTGGADERFRGLVTSVVDQDRELLDRLAR